MRFTQVNTKPKEPKHIEEETVMMTDEKHQRENGPEISQMEATGSPPTNEPEENEDITYHAVEKEGVITAIWEMKGKKHLRTIDPRSEEGRRILEAYKPSEKAE